MNDDVNNGMMATTMLWCAHEMITQHLLPNNQIMLERAVAHVVMIDKRAQVQKRGEGGKNDVLLR